jgi:hypothetical protein
MKSNITGTAVTIGGVVSGSVLASDRVVILATGVVLGDIITQRIQADEGCLLHGQVTVCQTREKWDSAVSEYRDTADLRSVTAAFAPRPPSVSGPSGAENVLAAAGSAPEAEGRTPARADETPQEAAFPGNAAAPTGEAAGLQDAASQNAAPQEEALPQDAAGPAFYPESAVSVPEETAFPGNAAAPAEEAAGPQDAASQNAAPENAFPQESAAPAPAETAFPWNAAAPAEEAAVPQDGEIPPSPPFGAAGAEKNHGES